MTGKMYWTPIKQLPRRSKKLHVTQQTFKNVVSTLIFYLIKQRRAYQKLDSILAVLQLIKIIISFHQHGYCDIVVTMTFQIHQLSTSQPLNIHSANRTVNLYYNMNSLLYCKNILPSLNFYIWIHKSQQANKTAKHCKDAKYKMSMGSL